MTASRDPTFGNYLRNKRLKARMGLREAAAKIGISPVYLGEVERGVCGPMKKERWPKLVEAIPGVRLDELRRTAEIVSGVQLDLSDATPAYRSLAHALARRFDEKNLDREQLRKILKIIEEEPDE